MLARLVTAGVLFAGVIAAGVPAAGQTPPKDLKDLEKLLKAAAGKDDDDPAKKFPPFDVVTKGAKVVDGLFTLYQKDDHVYMDIRPDQFDRPFLFPISVAKGAGIGGSMLNFGEEPVFSFKRVDDRIFLIRKNTRIKADAGSAIAKAVDTTYGDSVVMSLPIRTLNPAKGAVVIDLNNLFFTDFGELGLGYLDQSRTSWGKVKGYKKNVELQVNATFGAGRYFYGDDTVIDPRGTTVTIHYGIVDMPEGGFTARTADNRVGHFLQAVKDFSKEDQETAFVRYVQRWRLERADGSTYKPGGKLVPPKKRIVYWIEDSVPDEYRTVVREGILEWNKAFEKIGFKDAIEVRQQDGQDFDPEDMSYATVRWTAADSGGAIGPSRANPLTGEILDADILIDNVWVRIYKEEQRIYKDDAGRPVDPASPIRAQHRGWDLPRPAPGQPAAALGWNQRQILTRCQCAAHKVSEIATASLAAVSGTDDAKAPDEILQQGIRETVMHEVGHTLGLRHNFKASTMLPNDQLHDTTITRKQGLVGSVMDYNPANIAPKGQKQGDYFTTTLGPWDYWAIEYAYTPGASDDDLKKIAAKVADPKLVFGTDEDVYGSPDPYINRWDMGADPLRFAQDRVKLAEGLFATLADKAVAKGEGYSRLTRAFRLLLNEYGNAAYLATRYVGGAAVHRDKKGDPDGRDPLVPVPGDKQREALKFLRATILTDKSFQFSPDLLRKLGTEKWVHWGSSGYGSSPLFPLNQRVLAIQETALDELLDAGTLNRVQNLALTAPKADKPLAVAEIFRALTDSIFADLTVDGSKPEPAPKPAEPKKPAAEEKPKAEKKDDKPKDDAKKDEKDAKKDEKGEKKDDKAKEEPKKPMEPAPAGSAVMTRNLQRAYVARLAGMVLGPKADTGSFSFIVILLGGSGGGEVPADAKSLARLHLKEIAKRVDAGLKNAADDTQKAYLEETKERIAKVLDAKVAANEP